MNKQYLEGYDVRFPEVFRQGQTVRFRGADGRAPGRIGTILGVDELREYRILLLATGQIVDFIDESEIESL